MKRTSCYNLSPLKELRAFEKSPDRVLIAVRFSLSHYANMNSAQTSWASAIKRGGFSMRAHTTWAGHIVIVKEVHHG